MSLLSYYGSLGSQTINELSFTNSDDVSFIETLSHSGIGDEAFGIRSPEIFEFDVNTWGQLYMQRANTGAGGRVGIAYATSPKTDPHNWTKQGQIIVQGGSGDWDYEPGGATIFKEGGIWYVYYDGATNGKIGLASGANLASLTKHASNPLIDNTSDTGAFNAYSRHPAWGDKIGSTYYLFYEARDDAFAPTSFETGEITYATSTDLVNWTLSDATPLLSTNYPTGYFKKMAMPSISLIGNTYYMFILLSDPTGGEGFGRGGGIAYASSSDLITWDLVTSDMWLVYLRAQCGDWDTVRQECSLMMDSHNGEYALYMNGELDNGYINLNLGTFVNTLPSSLFEDDFTIFDANKWTKTEADGKTVSVSGNKLILAADGLETASAPVILVSDISFTWNDNDSFSLAFTWNNTDKSTGFKDFGLLNTARTYGWDIVSSVETDAVNFRFRDNGSSNDQSVTITQGDRVKFVKNQCRVSLWLRESGSWVSKNTITDASGWAGQTFTVQSAIANVSGNAMELQIGEVVVLPFDHNLETPYEL